MGSFFSRLVTVSSLAGAIACSGTLLYGPVAQAGTLTFSFSNGSFSAGAAVNPLVIQAADSLLDLDLPSSFSLSGSNLGGSFTVLDDPAQFLDGDITLDYDFLETVFGSYLDSVKASLPSTLIPPGLSDAQLEQTLDTIFDYSLTGSGTLSNSAGASTTFAINYLNDAFVINGFDPTVATSCLTLACTTSASGSFGLNASITGLLEAADDFNVPVSPTTVSLLNFYKTINGDAISVLTGGAFSYGATTSLQSANPTGTVLEGSLTAGTVTLTQTTNGTTTTRSRTFTTPTSPTGTGGSTGGTGGSTTPSTGDSSGGTGGSGSSSDGSGSPGGFTGSGGAGGSVIPPNLQSPPASQKVPETSAGWTIAAVSLFLWKRKQAAQITAQAALTPNPLPGRERG